MSDEPTLSSVLLEITKATAKGIALVGGVVAFSIIYTTTHGIDRIENRAFTAQGTVESVYSRDREVAKYSGSTQFAGGAAAGYSYAIHPLVGVVATVLATNELKKQTIVKDYYMRIGFASGEGHDSGYCFFRIPEPDSAAVGDIFNVTVDERWNINSDLSGNERKRNLEQRTCRKV